jgi:hypothetical protein
LKWHIRNINIQKPEEISAGRIIKLLLLLWGPVQIATHQFSITEFVLNVDFTEENWLSKRRYLLKEKINGDIMKPT